MPLLDAVTDGCRGSVAPYPLWILDRMHGAWREPLCPEPPLRTCLPAVIGWNCVCVLCAVCACTVKVCVWLCMRVFNLAVVV